MIVSENKIITRKITFSSNLVKFAIVCWLGYSSYCFWNNQDIIKSKNNEIRKLIIVNNELKDKISSSDVFAENVKGYFNSLNNYDRFQNIDVDNIKNKIDIKNSNLLSSEEYIAVLPVLNRIGTNIENINDMMDLRVYGLENAIKNTGINEQI